MDQYFNDEYLLLSILAGVIGVATASLAIWYTNPHYTNTGFEMPNIYPEPTYPDTNTDQELARLMLQQHLLNRLRDELSALTTLRNDIAALRQWQDSEQQRAMDLRRQIAALEQRVSTRPTSRSPRVEEVRQHLEQANSHRQLPPAQSTSTGRTRGLRRRHGVQDLRAQSDRQVTEPSVNGNTTGAQPSQRLTNGVQRAPSTGSRYSNARWTPLIPLDNRPSANSTRGSPSTASRQPRRMPQGNFPDYQNQRRTQPPTEIRDPRWRAMSNIPRAPAAPSSSSSLRVQAPTSPQPDSTRTPQRRGLHLPDELSEYYNTLTPDEDTALRELCRNITRDLYPNLEIPVNRDFVAAFEGGTEAITALYIPRAQELMRELRGSQDLASPVGGKEEDADAEVDVAAHVPLPEIVVNGVSGGSVSSTASTLVEEAASPAEASSGGSSSSNASAEVIEVEGGRGRMMWADEVEEELNGNGEGVGQHSGA
ncbi:hypothetical protein BDV96DRAFT_604919 [Lophiotrema nucula]|uniref:Uncharacterized protein n=1 Tax=Lophiotrema nucula TaxID=690887 RepID=A0A6A5YSX4_9PLEO|nr:hypothetical protein BDV96DRAFT_604919 [Lophiotrema nucula]